MGSKARTEVFGKDSIADKRMSTRVRLIFVESWFHYFLNMYQQSNITLLSFSFSNLLTEIITILNCIVYEKYSA